MSKKPEFAEEMSEDSVELELELEQVGRGIKAYAKSSALSAPFCRTEILEEGDASTRSASDTPPVW